MNHARTLRRQPIPLVVLILSALLGMTLASGVVSARADGTSEGAHAHPTAWGHRPPLATLSTTRCASSGKTTSPGHGWRS
jgi:hypothetical protein